MVDPDEEFDEIHWGIVQELRRGRCTPSLLAEVTGESRQLVSQRVRDLVMAGYVEKVHTGLYELVDDPGNHDRDDRAAESSPIVDESNEPAPSEPAVDGESDPLGAVEFPQGKDRQACVAAVLAARDYIHANNGATMRELVADVMPEHPLGYDVPELEQGDRYRGAWWRRIIRPGLEALAAVEKPQTGGSKWTYIGESVK